MALSDGRKTNGTMLQGRGGAGNIAPRSPAIEPADLKTPTIKSDLYTTGRGGTGNMALNLHSHPELARASQDVEAPERYSREPEASVHYGRGGAANIAHMSEEAKAGARARNASRRRSEAKGTVGLFGKEQREKEATEAAEREKGKGKAVADTGIFEKLTKVMTSASQSKK